MNRCHVIAAVTAALLLLAGCTTQPLHPVADNWQAHTQQLEKLDAWRLNGKMGYRQSGDGGSAWIEWQQLPEQFEVRLSGPFGAGTAYLRSKPGLTELTQAGEEPIRAASAKELTRHLFGWQWPVEDLQFWVRGLPSPHGMTQTLTLNEQHLLSSLEQSGWRLKFSRYSVQDQWLLPGKIHGQRLADDGATSFTLVIKAWQAGND